MATHNEVCHNWAHQTGKKRKGFNMFYEGNTIYSYGYHFPIARLVDGVVLFTTASRSVSTAKHKTITRRACSHLKVFHVPCLNSGFEGVNYEYYLSSIKEALDKAKRARKYGPSYMRQAEELIQEANDYSRHFELNNPELTMTTFGADMAELQASIAAQREETERREREEQRKRFVAMKAKVRDWLSFKTGDRPYTPFPVVRVNGDKLETTWGASVPFAQALAVYRYAKEVRQGLKKPCSLPGSVGDYGKAHIDRRGNIKVGCHSIPFLFARLAACRAGLDTVDVAA